MYVRAMPTTDVLTRNSLRSNTWSCDGQGQSLSRVRVAATESLKCVATLCKSEGSLSLLTMPTTHYDTHESGGGDYDSNPTLKTRAYTTIETEVESVLASDTEFGQTLIVNFTDTELVDGALYFSPDTGKYTLFSWKNVAEMSPAERYERGETPTADDAPNLVSRTYFGDDYAYELVAARVPELEEGGEVVVESTSKARDISWDDDGEIEFGDWEELGGDSVEMPDTVRYFDANQDTGASVSSTVAAEVLTTAGDAAVADEDDYQNWLDVPMGENILRGDLEDRRIQFFIVQRDSDETGFSYNLPVFLDLETDERIQANNRSEGGGSGNENPEESEVVQKAVEQDAGAFPDPLAEFISSGRRLELTEGRAETLLEEFVEDADNSLTWDMVEDNGGTDTVVRQVV